MVSKLAFLGSENFGTFEEKFGYFLTLYSKILSSSMGRGAKNTLSSLNSLIANVPSPWWAEHWTDRPQSSKWGINAKCFSTSCVPSFSFMIVLARSSTSIKSLTMFPSESMTEAVNSGAGYPPLAVQVTVTVASNSTSTCPGKANSSWNSKDAGTNTSTLTSPNNNEHLNLRLSVL